MAKRRFKGLLFLVVLVLSVTFYIYVVPDSSPSKKVFQSEPKPVLPTNRTIYRVDLDRNWSVALRAVPGTCVWMEWDPRQSDQKITVQTKWKSEDWKFWKPEDKYSYLGHVTEGNAVRLRATYDRAFFHYEFRKTEDCSTRAVSAKNSTIKVTHELLPGIWSSEVPIGKDLCIKWTGKADAFRVQTKVGKYGKWMTRKAGNPMDYIRWFGEYKGASVDFWIKPAGQCRD